MDKKIYVVTDLGPGDGGKGGVVHKISHMKRAHTILKVGGAQGSHGVTTSRGNKFAFSQFGCSTFEGAKTHLTQRFIASPEGILNEAASLKYEHGLYDIFNFLTIDEEVICATPYHGILSRIKELSLKDNPRGTIGTGVGEAYRYSRKYAELTIRAKDLSSNDLRNQLQEIQRQVSADLAPIIETGFLEKDIEEAEYELNRLNDLRFLDFIVNRFQQVAKEVRIVDRDYIRQNIFSKDGSIVVESSHGILTDHFQGFHPHTSAIRTLPRFTEEMLRSEGFKGEIVNIGVTRAYQIRHGAGPMPTANESMAEELLPGSHKEENRYQGKVRVGPLDLNLLRYAIAASGGTKAYDGLAISWFDQIVKNGSWWLCDRYLNTEDNKFFTPSGEIKVRFGADDKQLSYQKELGDTLNNCAPNLIERKIESSDKEKLYSMCAETLKSALGVQVRMISFGPTEQDKVCK